MLSKFAKQHSASGALAFAGYYVKALDWSLATTDPYLLRRISLPSCTTCSRYIEALDDLASAHGHLRGGRITIRSTRLVSGNWDVKSDYVIDAKTTQQPDVILRPSAAPSTEATKPNGYGSLIFVTWVTGFGWKIVEVEGDS